MKKKLVGYRLSFLYLPMNRIEEDNNSVLIIDFFVFSRSLARSLASPDINDCFALLFYLFFMFLFCL